MYFTTVQTIDTESDCFRLLIKHSIFLFICVYSRIAVVQERM